MASTSIANTAPASGVPKTPPNPPATPVISNVRVSPGVRTFNIRAMALAMPPPICTAVPSRPADPPHKWVTMVPMNTSGTIRVGTPPPGSWI